MMLFLRFNIFFHACQYRFADRNGKVFLLPAKPAMNKAILIDPVRRFAFEQPHYFIEVLSRTQRYKAMNMLNPAVQCSDKDVFCTGIFANVLKYFLTDRFRKNWLAVFGSPDKMYPNTNVRHISC